MLKYQVALLEQDNVELKVTTALNPAIFLQASEEAWIPLCNDCLVTIEQVFSGRLDLKSNTIQEPELNLHTSRNSMVQNGKWTAGYVVGTLTQVTEAQALPFNTSAQKAELMTLHGVLEITEGKRANIRTDLKYVFGIIHSHETIWKGIVIGTEVSY